MASGTENAAGIYIHLPFCRRKCPYCDFYSVPGNGSGRRAFLDALHRESALRAAPRLNPDTLYFGGGTPSLFTPWQIAGLIEMVRADFGLAAGAEITLEANPGTLRPENLIAYRRAGVNRLNLGVQSFDDRCLAFLGRIHDAAQSRQAIDQARAAGFENIGIDLIYALPGQTGNAWRSELAMALERTPAHLSCYILTYAPGTPLDDQRRQGRVRPLNDTQVAALFETTVETLIGAGFVHYEISNFALNGHPPLWSCHNRKYWNGSAYLGLGPAAHSFDGIHRNWNDADLDGYLDALIHGKRPPGGVESLTVEQRMSEALLLGLRQTEGIDTALFEARFAVDFERLFGPVLADLAESGLARTESGRLRLTRRGLLVADAVAVRMAGCF